jgi:hypothetical protein
MEWLVSIIILLIACSILFYTLRNFNGFDDRFLKEGFNTNQYELFPQAKNGLQDQLILPNPIQNDGLFHPIELYKRKQTKQGFEDLINTIKARGGNPGLIPSTAQMEAASNSGPDLKETEGAYRPLQEKIYPHEFPRGAIPALSASVPTDIGTVAEAIQSETPRTPSVREMIRNDGGKRVDDVYNITNPNEITYSHQ